MAQAKHYEGEFMSRDGHTVRCEIWREGTPASVGELVFPADEPLSIEWDTAKNATLQGSTATLTIESPTDRAYADLYATKAGSAWLHVYRDGALFWAGSLDTEFYEEPYTTNGGYDVTLTFSDLGYLDRLQCTAEGITTVLAMIESCIGKAQGGLTATLRQCVSTTFDGETQVISVGLSVRADNFTDEDGEVLSWHEALEGALQPLGLHLRQWAGAWYLYDLHYIAAIASTATTQWDGSDATLGVDKAANAIKITYSPYSKAELMETDKDYEPFEVDENATNLTKDETVDDEPMLYHTFYPDYSTVGTGDTDYWNLSFTMHYRPFSGILKHPGHIAACAGARIQFRIVPHAGGAACCGLGLIACKNYHMGIAAILGGYDSGCCMNGARYIPSSQPALDGTAIEGTDLFKTTRVYVPAGATGNTADLLRLRMEMMIDARYNPFEQASGDNESGNAAYFDARVGYVFMPFSATIYSTATGGEAICHYENYTTASSTTTKPVLSSTFGRWVDGEASTMKAFLQWYDGTNRAESSGVAGFKANRPCIGLTKRDIYESLSDTEDGQFMPLPPKGGWLEIKIFRDIACYDYPSTAFTSDRYEDCFGRVRWWLVKYPELTIRRRGAAGVGATDTADVEYSGVLDADAKDDMSVDTICGSAVEGIVGARGAYLQENGTPVATMQRAGRTETAEQLLIGTMYSQYATRHATLSGTLKPWATDRLPVLTDAAYDGGTARFAPTSETLDMIADEMEATLTETTADEYESI